MLENSSAHSKTLQFQRNILQPKENCLASFSSTNSMHLKNLPVPKKNTLAPQKILQRPRKFFSFQEHPSVNFPKNFSTFQKHFSAAPTIFFLGCKEKYSGFPKENLWFSKKKCSSGQNSSPVPPQILALKNHLAL